MGYFTHIVSKFLPSILQGNIIVPIVWVRKLKLREVKSLVQDHMVGKWLSWDLPPGLTLKSQIFVFCCTPLFVRHERKL